MATEHKKIHLNLDAVEDRRYEPYTFSVGGQTFQFSDPSLLDWQLVESLTTLDALAEHCMSEKDRKAFFKTPLAAYKLGLLFEDVQRHFQLGEHQPRRR